MKRYIIIVVLLSVFMGSFISCEKNIEFKGAVTDPLLVMNAILTPGSVVSVHLTQSRFVLGESTSIRTVDRATVSVFVNGQLKENLKFDSDGTYVGTYSPEPGDEIKIEVRADGYEVIESKTVIPLQPNVTVSDLTVTTEKHEETGGYGETYVVYEHIYRNTKLQLKLKDPADEENYYFIKCIQNHYYNGELVTAIPVDLKLSEVLKNNISGNEDIFDDFLVFGDGEDTDRIDNLFSDLFVNGKDILLDFSFRDIVESNIYIDGEIYGGDSQAEFTVEYVIDISEMSKDLYLYVISGNKAESAGDLPLSEPVKVHSNITNGIGILGSYSTHLYKISFQVKP